MFALVREEDGLEWAVMLAHEVYCGLYANQES